MNALSLAWSFIVAPFQASQRLRDRPTFLFPLLVVVGASAVLMVWYYNAVDLDWLKDYLFSADKRMQALPEEQRMKVLATVSRTTMTLSAVAAIVILEPAIFLLQALYFWVAGRTTGVVFDYRRWFALACWTSLPTLVAVIYGVVLLATSGHGVQLAPGAMQPLSLNELYFHRMPADPGFSLASGLTLLNLWVWFLCIVGVRTWSGRSWLFSSIFVMLPMVIIYGTWTAIVLRSAG
jgi:Yip1 domain